MRFFVLSFEGRARNVGPDMKLIAHGATDIGSVRSENEDSFICSEKLRVFAVADGIGGLPGGAQASRAALDYLEDWFMQHGHAEQPDYAAALRTANERVFLLGRELSPRYGIGTTLTLAHVAGTKLHVLHVGDSFLFRLRAGTLDALTTEHNLENEMRARAARGQPTAPLLENRAALTRCVGQPPPLRGDISEHEVEVGDRYLVCTDGVTRCITPHELTRILARPEPPAEIARELLQLARERGGLDNATAVVVLVE